MKRQAEGGGRATREGLSANAVRALADPTRLRILELLAQEPRTVAELAGKLPDVARTSMYYHLNVLERGGVVTVLEHRPGRRRPEKVYGAVDEGVISRPGHSQGATNVVLAALEVVRNEVAGEDDGGEGDERATVGKETLWLTDEEFDQIQEDISALLAAYRRRAATKKAGRGRKAYSLLTALYRLPG